MDFKDPAVIAAIVSALAAISITFMNWWISVQSSKKNDKILKEIEHVKSQLNKENISHQAYVSEMAQKRFNVLYELYSDMALLENEFKKFKRKPGASKNKQIEKMKKIGIMIDAIELKFRKTGLFLNDELKKELNNFHYVADLYLEYVDLENQLNDGPLTKEQAGNLSSLKTVGAIMDNIEELMKKSLAEIS